MWIFGGGLLWSSRKEDSISNTRRGIRAGGRREALALSDWPESPFHLGEAKEIRDPLAAFHMDVCEECAVYCSYSRLQCTLLVAACFQILQRHPLFVAAHFLHSCLPEGVS